MKFFRDFCWVLILGIFALYVFWFRPEKTPNVKEVQGLIDKHRADMETRKIKFERDLAQIKENGTRRMLQLVGETYLSHLKEDKVPPEATDYQELVEVWKSQRDKEPFVILWGVDLTTLPNEGRETLLAWEKTADESGNRCVLMADGKTIKMLTEAEFQTMPRAK